MKKYFYTLLLTFTFLSVAQAQTFDSSWYCAYATWDDQPNSTGHNTPAVSVIKPNTFVALVNRRGNIANYLVGYTNATDSTGRMGFYAYGSGGIGTYQMPWVSGFDLVLMTEAQDIAATRDSFIYVANNDAERNILVFKMGADSVYSADYRLATNADSIWAIDTDDMGRVYVSVIRPGQPGQVRVYAGINDNAEWAGSHVGTPLTTITVPDTGNLYGVTALGNGSVVYISNYTLKKVYCYTGSPAGGYTQLTSFSATLNDTLTATTTGTLVSSGPIGMNLLKDKNILAVATASIFTTAGGYELSRTYFLNPNTGAVLDTLDHAAWNNMITGGFNIRGSNGQQPRVSGYASNYAADWDDNGGLYTVSHYGWTVDKWTYSGVLPTIPLTITGIEKTEGITPEGFSLSQNFPNPFNPSTTIEFSINTDEVISLSVYDINGQLITDLISSSNFEKGTYKITFDASKLASGTYVYTLKAGNFVTSKKMTLLK